MAKDGESKAERWRSRYGAVQDGTHHPALSTVGPASTLHSAPQRGHSIFSRLQGFVPGCFLGKLTLSKTETRVLSG